MKAKRTKPNGKVAAWPQVAKIVKAASRDHAPSASRKAALKRIGVSEEALRTCARITPMLRQAEGGMKQIYEAMRLVPDDQVIAAYLTKYDSLPADDRRRVSVEAVALAAGVDVRSLLGSILIALQAQSVSLVKMLMLAAHPSIVRARIKFGQQPAGTRDRQALDTALGLLPPPRQGTTIIGRAIFGSGEDTMRQQRQLPGRHGNAPEDEDDPLDETPLAEVSGNIDLNKLFPPANEMQERLIAIRNRDLSETTGKPTPRWLKN